jgi:predicted nucleic acid-binding protein
MSYRTAILDTGMLVALLSKSDQFHFWASAILKKLPPLLVTSEAVISELFFLLRNHNRAKQVAASMLIGRAIKVIPMTEEIDEIHGLITKYNSVPMSYADAALVRLAEITTGPVIVTTDADFKVYRFKRNQRIPVILPSSNIS